MARMGRKNSTLHSSSVSSVKSVVKKFMAALSRGAATDRKFEDVVKSAEQAAVLVLVY